MRPVIVMVAFYSESGRTEKLATAVAVGAVQRRAAIRMRRVPDSDLSAAIQKLPQFRSELVRMNKYFVAPKEADVLEADALVFGVPADFTASSVQWKTYLELLSRLARQGKLAGKVALALGGEPGLGAFSEAIAPLRVSFGSEKAFRSQEILPDDTEGAIRLGHAVVEAVGESEGFPL